LPIQATPEQLQQAHRDRGLQLPRREYSPLAIAARRELLDEAYRVLANPITRQEYDSKFVRSDNTPLSEALGSGQPGPQIDVAESQLVGALLLFQELGEYELVLQLGTPLISRPRFQRALGSEADITHADITLTVALAYLELGREYWHQGHYESAATALETGQDLLMQDGLFTAVRGEIKGDLYKLRPYRVLELVSLGEDNPIDRRKGIQILRDMLQERGGIDGNGDDQSGLSIDDFLRFVQQLRDYLTAEEQQAIFEAEARRPSAVATYLCVYALLARGFAQHRPEFIRRAKSMLMRLGKRQDVHLEQAICALFLGQTEEASYALELSREYEAITFIRTHSQGSPDWLPGLCLYAEQWLREEVFPHFRDLARYQTTLKEYFADDQVQRYLDSMPSEAANLTPEWENISNLGPGNASPAQHNGRTRSTSLDPRSSGLESRTSGFSAAGSFPPGGSGGYPGASPEFFSDPLSPNAPPPHLNPGVASQGNPGDSNGNGDLLGGLPGGRSSGTPKDSSRTTRPPGENRSRRQRRQDTPPSSPPGRIFADPATNGSRSPQNPVGDAFAAAPSNLTTSPSFKLGRLLLLGGTGLLMIWGLVFVVANVVGWVQPEQSTNPESAASEEILVIRLDEPLLAPFGSPSPAPGNPAEITLPQDMKTPTDAQQLIEAWLKAKGEAMGKTYNTKALDQVLTGEELGFRQRAAESAREEGYYAEYEHQVTVESLQPDTTDPDRAVAIAKVREVAVFYKNGQVDNASSYEENLRLQYDFLRKDEQWHIQRMKFLSSQP